MMNKCYSFLLIALWLPLITLADSVTVIDESKTPHYLFVISSESGLFKGEKILLKGTHPVLYFMERPYRKAGHMSLEAFIGQWNKGSDSFKADPPNATLSALDIDGGESVVVELMRPRLKDNLLIFDVAVIEGSLPTNFKHNALFIDGGSSE